MASHARREAGADVLGAEERRLLDRTFEELARCCMLPCENYGDCAVRDKYEGVIDNARVPFAMRIWQRNADLTATAKQIPDEIYRGSEGDFDNRQEFIWRSRTPRQLFRYNQVIIQKKLPRKNLLQIRCDCIECGFQKVLNALDTKEKLHLEVRELIAHDRQLPLLYVPKSQNIFQTMRVLCATCPINRV